MNIVDKVKNSRLQLLDNDDVKQGKKSQSPSSTGIKKSTKCEVNRPTTYAKALSLIEENKIKHYPTCSHFTVLGTFQSHIVTLFPERIYFCAESKSSRCYHITPCKISIGIRSAESKRPVNASRLRTAAKVKTIALVGSNHAKEMSRAANLIC